ncbi:hypothetical protein Hypma_015441 [Hypsizygus marmoreus]|uniref:Uncharacterized protein n=1 Tax=Hypsizygus marmoreus TaxID=39966 RepID=A0A369K1U1_HYPMA|nr:hypothetical protein Hypma_015441 [Hypsizygus marmoreus]
MPSVVPNHDVLLDFTNDTHDCVTVQLLRDYGRDHNAIVLLNPEETITLVLDSGSVYRYAIKTHTKVVNVTARSWTDTSCQISHLFSRGASSCMTPIDGIRVDRLWRDYRVFVWTDF